jgi:hypothetical protein
MNIIGKLIGKLFRVFFYYCYVFKILAHKIHTKITSLHPNKFRTKQITTKQIKKKIRNFLELIKYNDTKASDVINYNNYKFKIKLQKKIFSKSFAKYSSSIKTNSKSFFHQLNSPIINRLKFQ